MTLGDWTLYGCEACACCHAAAGILLAYASGLPLCIQMAAPPAHGVDPAILDLPALVDPRGSTVWSGAFDEAATQRALEQWGVLHPTLKPEEQDLWRARRAA
jgi:hypothetical protein